MNRDEAKTLLLLYRPGTAYADDPEMAGALALAKGDVELARWLEEQVARQEVLRAKFRQIPVPAGLQEQIISEQPSRARGVRLRPSAVLAVAVLAVVLLAGLISLLNRPEPDDTLAHYRMRMASAALRGYSMDLETSDPQQIRDFLAQRQAPATFELPPGLRKATVVGCAVQQWQHAKVSMICFHTGKPLAPGEKSNLWLFVIEQGSLKDAPAGEMPAVVRVNKLLTGIWTRGGMVYLLGMEGEEPALREYL